MEEYDYRGYPIGYNADGNYEIDFDDCVMEFVTYEEATEWIDAYLEEHPKPKPKRHAYNIFFVIKNHDHGFNEIVHAYTEDAAIAMLKRMYPDIAYITDCYQFGD